MAKELEPGEFPPIHEQTVKVLEARYPELEIEPGMDDAQLMYRAGQRSVVKLLRETFDQQQQG